MSKSRPLTSAQYSKFQVNRLKKQRKERIEKQRPKKVRPFKTDGMLSVRQLKIQMFINAKDTACSDCGNSFPSCVMDFHHLDPSQKTFSIGQCIARKDISLVQMKEEIKKCIVICSNCHRIRHFLKEYDD